MGGIPGVRRFSDDEVREIRRSKASYPVLAKYFKVSTATICKIKKHETYSDVPIAREQCRQIRIDLPIVDCEALLAIAKERDEHMVDVAANLLHAALSEARPKDHDGAGHKLKIDMIISAVADEFEVSPEQIKGRQRQASIVLPRQVVCWLAYQDPTISLPQIGAFLNRDHTTILHSFRKIKEKAAADPFFSRCLSMIEGRLSA